MANVIDFQAIISSGGYLVDKRTITSDGNGNFTLGPLGYMPIAIIDYNYRNDNTPGYFATLLYPSFTALNKYYHAWSYYNSKIIGGSDGGGLSLSSTSSSVIGQTFPTAEAIMNSAFTFKASFYGGNEYASYREYSTNELFIFYQS